MKLSLIYSTGRLDPRLDWTLDALAGQWAVDDEVELILVDVFDRGISPESTLCGAREQAILARCPQITRVIALPPMPNIWQGKYRVTSRDWFATGIGRNTGIVLATHPHVAFLDDRCRPGSQWVATVRQYAITAQAVAAGSYDKLEGPAAAPHVVRDHRLDLHPQGKVDCGGGWLYGCSFTLPLAWALEVNGFEDGCGGMIGGDYIFGMMLANAGHRIDFVPTLHVNQDRTGDNTTCKVGIYGCCDKGTPPDNKIRAAIARFGTRAHTEFTPDLSALRAVLAAGGSFPIPDPTVDYRDWFDDELVREMKS